MPADPEVLAVRLLVYVVLLKDRGLDKVIVFRVIWGRVHMPAGLSPSAAGLA